VLATTLEDGTLFPLQLTTDFKPNLLSEIYVSLALYAFISYKNSNCSRNLRHVFFVDLTLQYKSVSHRVDSKLESGEMLIIYK
jgi:hypothetical protein